MASRDEAPECAGCRLQAGFSFAARFSDSCACVLRVWAGGDMYDGSESDRTTTLTSPPLFSTSRRASRMAGGSYLPANDWCPGHLQRSTLTCSTACRYPPTDCDTLSVCICHAREGKNHTVFYVDRVTAAPSHRRHTGLPPTRALHHMHTMDLCASGTKTTHCCDSSHTTSPARTRSPTTKPLALIDGLHSARPQQHTADSDTRTRPPGEPSVTCNRKKRELCSRGSKE